MGDMFFIGLEIDLSVFPKGRDEGWQYAGQFHGGSPFV
jgi:hypothetical protein